MTESPFTKSNTKLQRAWDATSYNALLFCPRYYQYTILDGYRQEGNNDLEFGGLFARCAEHYKKARLDGQTKEQATINTLRFAIEASWPDDQGPWSGRYENAWRCTGNVPYRNVAGHRAKCPWGHAGAWFPEPSPDTCTCGSNVERQVRWVSSFTKDRYALIRLVAAYCDAQPKRPEDGAFPIKIGGIPAVELSFSYPLPWNTPDGEPYIAAGHIDSIEKYGGENFIADDKTTAKPLNAKYWQTYSPNTQVDFYDLAGTVLWPELHLKGILIHGAQITKTNGVVLGLGIARRNDAQREETLQDLRYWLSQAERYAREDYWPKNTRNCWACPFNNICSKDPGKRRGYLEAGFEKRHWNPLEER